VLITGAVVAAGLFLMSDRQGGPAKPPGQAAAPTADRGRDDRTRQLASAATPGRKRPARPESPAAEPKGEVVDLAKLGTDSSDAEKKEPVGSGAPTAGDDSAPAPGNTGAEKVGGPPRPAPKAQKAADGAGARLTPAERKKVEQRWRKTLDDLHVRGLHARRGPDADTRRAGAEKDLEAITDPEAVPALWRVFAGSDAHHLLLARVLGRIESPESSRMLAQLAVFSQDPKARLEAIRPLRTRDPGDFGAPLVNLISRKMNYRRDWLDTGHGVTSVLLVETEKADYRFIYPPAEQAPGPSGPSGFYTPDNPYFTAENRRRANELNRQQEALTRASIRGQIELDIAEVTHCNERIEETNTRAVNVLREVSGRPFGPIREEWGRWLAERLGRSYQPPEIVTRTTIEQVVPHWFQATFLPTPTPT
jgi:hypothetical protein